ncbi:RiPP maturation radical SAM C-methyltransferase, partial [uncultured Alcanivorax sp.]
ILKAGCEARGISCVVDYASLRFRDLIGENEYFLLASCEEYPFLGELSFVREAYPEQALAEDYVLKCLSRETQVLSCKSRNTLGITRVISRDIAFVQNILDRIPQFLEETCDNLLSGSPKIIGFSSTFQQTNPIIAISKIIRRRAPDVKIVFGGANFDWPMGSAWSKNLPHVDAIFSGESDNDFPAYCQAVLNEVRTAAPTPAVVRCTPVEHMDSIPIPDYGEYVAANSTSRFPEPAPKIVFEASRGCWWGAKQHCTFCGLNSNGMTARYKSQERLSTELAKLVEKYSPSWMQAADNILPVKRKLDVPTAIMESGLGPSYFFEVKANLTEAEINELTSCGIKAIQPGIESLSTRTLKEMRKGTTGAKNIALLRNCMEAGIYVSWNYLYGFPGESRADFEGIIEIIPAISHLSPPEGFGPIRFDRYSPYHSDPESFGVDEVKPFRHYLDIFPFSRSHDEIAYHFSSAQPLGINADSDFLSFFGNRIQNWIDCWEREERPYLRLSKINSDYYLIEDTRSLANEQFSVVERTVADALSALRTPISVFDRDQMYNELIDRGWVVELDGLAVSVVMAA